MPQGINDFMRVASGLSDATPLRAEQDQVTQATYKRGATRTENMQANTETAKAFLNAVRSHPGYASGEKEVEALLSSKIEKGLPLCADEVRTVVRQLNVSQIKVIGHQLEEANILPEGASMGFFKHTLATFGPLEGEHAVRSAVRDYLVRVHIPTCVSGLMHIDAALVGQNIPNLSTDDKAAIQTALVAYHGAADAESYMKSVVIKNIAEGLQAGSPAHPEFGKGLAGLAEIGVTNLFAQVNRDEIRLLAALPPNTRDTVLKNPDLLRTLMDSQNTLSFAEQIDFIRYVSVNQLPLGNKAEQTTVMRDFLLIQAGLHMQQPLPLGLPAQLALPLVFNSEVKRDASNMLQTNPGPGVIPTHAQVENALLQARDAFATAHAPVLKEFLQMAMNPPDGLNTDPPLSPQTLPQYLNALLSGDAILEPLFNDSRPVDDNYLHSVLLYNQNMESAGDVVGSAMGLDDANKLHEGAVKLLMARRGVGEAEYPAMMERGIARFGRMISELNTLSDQCFSQVNDSAQRSVLNIRRVLSSTLVNVAEQLTPANCAALSLPANTSDMLNELLSRFDVPVELNEFSAQMHAFGTSLGIQLPPTNSAVAKSAMEQQLFEANLKIGTSTLARILGDGVQLRAATTPFVDLVRDIAADLALDNLDVALLEPSLFTKNANKLLHELATDASSQNATLDAGTIRSALRQSIAMDMQEMHSLIAQIDTLPKPSHLPEEQHGERKRIMKDMVHLYPITDMAVLSRLMDKAAGSETAMNKLRAPQGTPYSMASAISTLTTEFEDIIQELGQGAMPPQNVAVACYLDMALRSSKMDAVGATHMQQSITGEIGKSVASSYRYFMASGSNTPEQKAKPQLAHSMMTQLATLSTILVDGKAEHQPLRFATGIGHISEIPHACIATIAPSFSPMQQALNVQTMRFSPAQWDMLEHTYKALGQGITRYQDPLPGILANHASQLIAAAEARGNPVALSMNQVAIAVMGSRLTPEEDRNGTTDGERLCNAFVGRYTKNASEHIENVSASSVEKALRMGLANGFSFSLLNNLASPDARLTLEKMPPSALELGSLGNYTAGNAFGLREDFPRLAAGSITVENVKGKQHVYSPSVFPDKNQGIPADHPVFQNIIADILALATSDAQMLRIMHILTQAGRKCVGMSVHTFPNSTNRSGLVPPMAYSIDRTENNRVVVTMKSLATDPLVIEQKFLVDEDGSYAVTEFLMHRRSAVNENPAQA